MQEVEKQTIYLDKTTTKLTTSKVGKEDLDSLESKFKLEVMVLENLFDLLDLKLK